MGCLCCLALPDCICLSAASAAEDFAAAAQHLRTRGWQYAAKMRSSECKIRILSILRIRNMLGTRSLMRDLKKQPCRFGIDLQTICYALLLVSNSGLR